MVKVSALWWLGHAPEHGRKKNAEKEYAQGISPKRLCLWSSFIPIGDARFFIDRVLIVVAVIPRQGHILYSLWLEGYI